MAAKQQTPAPSTQILSDVVCGVDGTRTAYEAVRQAASLTGPDGHLTLVAVTGMTGSGRYKGTVFTPVRARRALDHARRLARETGVSSDPKIEGGGPVAEVLLDRARGRGVLALGAPSMSRLGHLLIGGITTAAAHALPCSLLLVARRSPAGTSFGERIMVASDGLSGSDDLVDFAAALAREREAWLLLLHAARSESASHLARIAAQGERVRKALGSRSAVRVEPGRAHDVIVGTAAGESVSLIVMGSRRLGGLRALGSVSERVVHDAPCSVLVMRPEDMRR